jgi:hypothetical protein
MDVQDWTSLLSIVALAASWIWLLSLHLHLSYSDWRRKASLAAFGCVSIALLLGTITSGFMHLILAGGVSQRFGHMFLAILRPILWIAVSVACGAIILVLVGKGRPRILVLAWLCFLCVPNVSLLPAMATGLYSQWREAAPIRNRLKVLAGGNAVNCGTLNPWTAPKPSSICVLKSFENRKPFFALYDTQEVSIDSRFIDGLAGDNLGNLYDVEFSSKGWSTQGLTGQSQLTDGGHILVEPCPKPITLTPSIYKGITCIARTMASTIARNR